MIFPSFQIFTFSIEDQPKEPVEQAPEEAPRKMRERPTSARPAKRVKAPVVEEIAPPAVVNPNGRFLGFLVPILKIISVIIDENDDDEDENDLGFDEQIGTIEIIFPALKHFSRFGWWCSRRCCPQRK